MRRRRDFLQLECSGDEALATLALGSRELALKLGGRSGAFANAVWTLCALGGSVLILLFGAILFAASSHQLLCQLTRAAFLS